MAGGRVLGPHESRSGRKPRLRVLEVVGPEIILFRRPCLQRRRRLKVREPQRRHDLLYLRAILQEGDDAPGALAARAF